MSELANLFLNTLSSGLKRKTLTSAARWSEACRVMGGVSFPGPWRFKHHPWLREMHDSHAELNVGQKSAQMGYTETVLNLTFYHIDVKGVDCLYVLPAKTPDASDFSASRFDAALELSPHLANMFSDVKNVGHKRAGSANLYIRGSKSRSGLKSVPVGFIVLDEVDEMDQDNIRLALERTAGQMEKLAWMISTPTLEGWGINKYYKISSQNHFFFPCPSCNQYIELQFPDNIVIVGESIEDPRLKESYLKCDKCEAKLPHESKTEWLNQGKWIETYSDRDSKGWHINQLYSPTIKPSVLAASYFASFNDKSEEQEFYNSKLGLPHEVDGARITDEQLLAVRGEFATASVAPAGLITMGIDVGKWLHYEIDHWTINNVAGIDLNLMARCRILVEGKCRDFEELDVLMRQFQVNFAVIDAHPERRKAYEFSSRFHGHVRMNFYGTGVTGKQIHISDGPEPTITVDRTSWLDLSLGRFKTGTIRIPADTSLEYKKHVKSLVRVYEKDSDGNPIGRYQNTGDDHFAHARNYAEIALPLALNLAQHQTITSF